MVLVYQNFLVLLFGFWSWLFVEKGRCLFLPRLVFNRAESIPLPAVELAAAWLVGNCNTECIQSRNLVHNAIKIEL